MIGLIVLGLAFLFFVVVAFFAAKTWHVGHVVAMAFLFLFTLLTLFMTATLMRTNKQYHPKYSSALDNLERKKSENQRLMYGDGADSLAVGTISGEQVLAKKDRMTRGRIWRNVIPMQAGNAQRPFVLNMGAWNNDGCLRVGNEEDELSDEELEPIADESGDDAGDEGAAEEGAEDAGVAAVPAPDDSHGIKTGQYIYAFKEMPIAALTKQQKEHYFGSLSEEGDELFPNKDKKGYCRVPIAYLGKFQVMDSKPNIVAAQLQGIPDRGQAAQLQARGAWVLYEQLPIDVEGLFEGKDEKVIREMIPLQSQPNNWSLQTAGVAIPPPTYNKMINDYFQDGKDFNGRADPMRLHVQVEFLQEYPRVVDLQVGKDAEGNPRPLPPADTPFNSEGLAQVPGLLQGGEGKTVFEPGDTAFFDGATAQNLIRQGKAKEVGRKFRRQLRAFEFSIDDYQKRFDAVAVRVQEVTKRVDALKASLARLQSQIDKHQEELQLLEKDKEGFESEMNALRKFRDELKLRRSALEGEVNSLASGYTI